MNEFDQFPEVNPQINSGFEQFPEANQPQLQESTQLSTQPSNISGGRSGLAARRRQNATFIICKHALRS